jgi:hypothetical protein
MLTFICGWRSPHRDSALIQQRASDRKGIFFLDNQSTVAELLPDTPIIELWRNGRLDFQPDDHNDMLIRINYDTENDLLQRAITRVLLSDTSSQIIVTYNAINSLSRLFPALRGVDALVAADERLDAAPGDHVVFTRGGSFRWSDRMLEAKTVLLTNEEVYDGGIVPDNLPDVYESYDTAWG